MKGDLASVREYFLHLQQSITGELERIGGGTFQGSELETPGGGLSRPRVLQDGDHIEKAAVLFTHGVGAALPPAASERNPALAGKPFQAVAISLIVHPRNPFVPTTHKNLRFFLVGELAGELADAGGDGEAQHWHFGGGYDLTPHYPNLEDARHWHRTAREAAGEHYPVMKAACDEYFSLPHRGETRGIGGLFFDDWNEGGFEEAFALVQSIGDSFLPAYIPIAQRHLDDPYGADEEEWMLIRRGRYAEFNLAIDRGTRYGLQSGRRVESVLASLPPRAKWVYDHHPADGSPEADLVQNYLKPRDWI